VEVKDDVEVKDEYVEHALIKPNSVEKRLYQLAIAATALQKSTLAVLPTGLGKTIIALLTIASRLKDFPTGKALILSPTKPLVEQHAQFLKRLLLVKPEEIAIFTGEVSIEKRKELWDRARVIVSTPQVIENDLMAKRIELSNVVHLTFDEAHRATGNYSYVYIANKYVVQAKQPLILGITASPGSDELKIDEVCKNLHISAVELRTERDPDVAPYVFKKDIEWRYVKLPSEVLEIKRMLESVLAARTAELYNSGIIERREQALLKRELLQLQQQIQAELAEKKEPQLYHVLSLLAEILKLRHGIELCETQGIDALRKYFERLSSEASSRGGSKASKRLLSEENIQRAITLAKNYNATFPKIEEVKKIVASELEQNPNSRIIIFTNYRDTAELITEILKSNGEIKPVRFVGQASKFEDKGLSQKQQVEILEKFKAGDYNVLVATSVAEEGLDIPSTDLVLFYEPVPSEIRSIQRRGRTGRHRVGRIIVLIAKGTRDEAYFWISHRKEREMNERIREMQAELADLEDELNVDMLDFEDRYSDSPVFEGVMHANYFEKNELKVKRKGNGKEKGKGKGEREGKGEGEREGKGMGAMNFEEVVDRAQKTIFDYSTEAKKVNIYVDTREMRSPVAKALEEMGAIITLKTLEVGDYILSERVGVERKTVEDFLSSLIDRSQGRDLFAQMSELARNFERPVLILEGEGLYTARRIDPNAVRGMLASISIDFGIPIISTVNPEDTAALLYIIGKREQFDEKREISLHSRKTSHTLKEQQEYLVSAIPGVGLIAAKNLLRHFGSIEAIMTASIEDLMKVEKIGRKTAKKIKELVASKYE
jgi:Fanconi anemia group M protein